MCDTNEKTFVSPNIARMNRILDEERKKGLTHCHLFAFATSLTDEDVAGMFCTMHGEESVAIPVDGRTMWF